MELMNCLSVLVSGSSGPGDATRLLFAAVLFLVAAGRDMWSSAR